MTTKTTEKDINVRIKSKKRTDKEARRFAIKWSKIKYRCYNEKCPVYPLCGGRGIHFSEEWQDVENFISWCKQTYPKTGEEWSLDRIDNNKDYSSQNCRWASARTQANNRRNNVIYKGKTLAEWSKITGIKPTTINRRLHVMKWPIEKALFKPVQKARKD